MHASKTVIWIIGAIVGLIIVLLAFRLGMVIGYRQAEYSGEWQYLHSENPAAEGTRMLWRDASDNNGFLNDHGAIGTVVSITNAANDLPASIVVRDTNDNADKTILISSTTSIIAGSQGQNPFSVLRAGQSVAIIGAPDTNGQIVASIIHLLPASPRQ